MVLNNNKTHDRYSTFTYINDHKINNKGIERMCNYLNIEPSNMIQSIIVSDQYQDNNLFFKIFF